jgi:hypothetical protein
MDLLNKTQIADSTPAVTNAMEEGVAVLLFFKTFRPPSESTESSSQ